MLNFSVLLFLQAPRFIGPSDPTAMYSQGDRSIIMLAGAIAFGALGLFVTVKTLLRWKSLRQPITHLLGGISALAFAAIVFLFQYLVLSNLN